MKLSILLLFVVGVAHANLWGSFRKRFNGNPDLQPEIQNQEEEHFRASRVAAKPQPIAGVAPPVVSNSSSPGIPPPSAPVPNQGGGQPAAPVLPDFPPPVRPDVYYQLDKYLVFDVHHSRYLNIFDPEAWVSVYPGFQFPRELDIPPRWNVYNPVTVQAPLPYLDQKALKERYYTGYYYACPERANPFKFSWFRTNEPPNPCKWTFFQTREDALKFPSNTTY